MEHPKIPGYLKELIICNDSEFYLTADIDKLELEVRNNCIYVSFSPDELSNVTVADIEKFLADLKADRKRKLIKSKLPIDLIFYIWFDEMAGQLRFNFINSNHKELPFRAEIEFVSSEKVIIEDYLNISLERIGIYEVNKIDYQGFGGQQRFMVKVYSEIIDRK